MARLDGIVLETLMAARDIVFEDRLNDVRAVYQFGWPPRVFRWPLEFYRSISEGGAAWDIDTSDQQEKVRLLRKRLAVATDERIERLKSAFSGKVCYEQTHIDVLCLAVFFEKQSERDKLLAISGLTAAEERIFRLEAAIRQHWCARLGLSDERELDVDSYLRRSEAHGRQGKGNDDYSFRSLNASSLALASASDERYAPTPATVVGSASLPVTRQSPREERGQAERRLQAQVEGITSQLAASDRKLKEARSEVDELTKSLASVSQQLSESRKRNNELSAKLTRSSQQPGLASRGYSSVAPTAGGRRPDKEAIEVLPAAVATESSRHDAREERDIQRLLDSFTSLLDRQRLVRGDDFCQRLHARASCPANWQLSTWNSQLTVRESSEEWQILLAEAPTRPGCAREAHVFVASQCPISERLISLFDGCTGHSFDARIARTLRPARVQYSGSTFSVCLLKGEVRVS